MGGGISILKKGDFRADSLTLRSFKLEFVVFVRTLLKYLLYVLYLFTGFC